MRGTIEERGWSPELQSFVATFDGEELDASLLLLHELDFLDGDDPRFVSTVEAIERALRRGPYMFRYSAPDDFGAPETAFNVCTFWFIEALHAIGREAEARELFEHMLASRTALGLLSEDIDPRTHEHWGNFPQTYSLVGIVHAAMRLSKSWDEAL
jgi:GH15 family glucan-1,4-alpha-glucosidase